VPNLVRDWVPCVGDVKGLKIHLLSFLSLSSLVLIWMRDWET
jgi:hypothetical protein